MSITKRFITLLLVGMVLLILSISSSNIFTVFILYNLICIILLLVDYYISNDIGYIYIKRYGKEKLSIYEEELIKFELYNKSNNEVYVEIKDEMPEFHFNTENKIVKGTLLPREKKIFAYIVVPTKRGAFTFGNLHIKVRGRLKLVIRTAKINLTQEYKVYPNMKNLRKYRLSMVNNRMLKQGQKAVKTLGRGTSFESLREYVFGDEYRKINWKATARGNKPIVNQYEPEKNQHVYMFIDTGRAMSYTVRGHRKLDLVVNTALVLSDVINQNGDQSGLLLFNTEVDNMVLPGKGPGHRNKMLETLYHIDYTKETSNYDDAFYYFKKKERHRSIIFLFTDFDTIEEAENMLKLLPIVSRNNIIVMVLIKNESIEKISSQKIHDNEGLFNKGVALDILDERQKIISLLNRRGIFCVECEAEKLEYTAINKYIQVKNKGYLG